jgi:hypothetical protein
MKQKAKKDPKLHFRGKKEIKMINIWGLITNNFIYASSKIWNK